MKKLIVEVEAVGQPTVTLELEEPSLEKLIKTVHEQAKSENLFIFEKDKDEELSSIEGRSAISLIAHHCRRVAVQVNFEHLAKSESFPPSATVFRVLRWAIGKHGFNLDDTARAKANLILLGNDSPLPRDETIGKYVIDHGCSLTLELTLRDFTNGRN